MAGGIQRGNGDGIGPVFVPAVFHIGYVIGINRCRQKSRIPDITALSAECLCYHQTVIPVESAGPRFRHPGSRHPECGFHTHHIHRFKHQSVIIRLRTEAGGDEVGEKTESRIKNEELRMMNDELNDE